MYNKTQYVSVCRKKERKKERTNESLWLDSSRSVGRSVEAKNRISKEKLQTAPESISRGHEEGGVSSQVAASVFYVSKAVYRRSGFQRGRMRGKKGPMIAIGIPKRRKLRPK